MFSVYGLKFEDSMMLIVALFDCLSVIFLLCLDLGSWFLVLESYFSSRITFPELILKLYSTPIFKA